MIDDGVLRWVGHVERRKNYRTTKRAYAGECTVNRSISRRRKRWIDTVKDCLKKRSLDVRQTTRMVHYRSVWQEFVRENTWGVARGMNP